MKVDRNNFALVNSTGEELLSVKDGALQLAEGISTDKALNAALDLIFGLQEQYDRAIRSRDFYDEIIQAAGGRKIA